MQAEAASWQLFKSVRRVAQCSVDVLFLECGEVREDLIVRCPSGVQGTVIRSTYHMLRVIHFGYQTSRSAH